MCTVKYSNCQWSPKPWFLNPQTGIEKVFQHNAEKSWAHNWSKVLFNTRISAKSVFKEKRQAIDFEKKGDQDIIMLKRQKVHTPKGACKRVIIKQKVSRISCYQLRNSARISSIDRIAEGEEKNSRSHSERIEVNWKGVKKISAKVRRRNGETARRLPQNNFLRNKEKATNCHFEQHQTHLSKQKNQKSVRKLIRANSPFGPV